MGNNAISRFLGDLQLISKGDINYFVRKRHNYPEETHSLRRFRPNGLQISKGKSSRAHFVLIRMGKWLKTAIPTSVSDLISPVHPSAL